MNKKFKYSLIALFASAIVFAAAEPTVDVISSAFPQWFQSGIYIGSPATNPIQSTTNKITNMLATPWTSWDFPAIGGAPVVPTCSETVTITLTGASIGDDCRMASNFGMDGGSAMEATAVMSCRAVTNGVVGKVCIGNTNDGGTTGTGTFDLGDAGYRFFTRQ